MQFGITKHEQIFQRLAKLDLQFGVFENFTSAYLFQIAHEKSLLINDIEEKFSRCLSRRNARVSRNQGKITASRARA